MSKIKTCIPLPTEDYVYNVGLIAYSIGYLEWQILGDLCSKKDIPDEYKINKLSKQSTGQIATLFLNDELLSKVLDDELKIRIKQFGEKLRNIAERKNHILHAHPATIDGEQRFYRWTPDHQIEINESYLERTRDDIEHLLKSDSKLRK